MITHVMYYSIGVVIGGMAGFLIGKCHERWEWSSMIRSTKDKNQSGKF